MKSPSKTTMIRAAATDAALTVGDSSPVLYGLGAESVDVAFADPPYFLSGSGSTCKGGQRVSVKKGAWDAPVGAEAEHAFACRWIAALAHALKPTGSLWISGTAHSIRHVHRAAVDTLGWQLQNEIIWVKRNPPPNLSCKMLTHSHETLLWLRKPGQRPGDIYFDYKAARLINRSKQMRDVWDDILPPSKTEKARGGGHPTQKPVARLERIMLLSLPAQGVAVDPFLGSGTTLEAAALAGASRFVGADLSAKWIEVSIRRGQGAAALIAERAAEAPHTATRRRAA